MNSSTEPEHCGLPLDDYHGPGSTASASSGNDYTQATGESTRFPTPSASTSIVEGQAGDQLQRHRHTGQGSSPTQAHASLAAGGEHPRGHPDDIRHDRRFVCSSKQTHTLRWYLNEPKLRSKRVMWVAHDEHSPYAHYRCLALDKTDLTGMNLCLPAGAQLEVDGTAHMQSVKLRGDPENPALIICRGPHQVSLTDATLTHCTLVVVDGARVTATNTTFLGSGSAQQPILGIYTGADSHIALTGCTLKGHTIGSLLTDKAVGVLETTSIEGAGVNAAEVRHGARMNAKASTFAVAAPSPESLARVPPPSVPEGVFVHGGGAAVIDDSTVTGHCIGLFADGEGTRVCVTNSRVHSCVHTGVLVQARAEATLSATTVEDIRQYQGVHVRGAGTRLKMSHCRVQRVGDACVFATAGAKMHMERVTLSGSTKSQGLCASDAGTEVQCLHSTFEEHYETCAWIRESAAARFMECTFRNARTCQCVQVVDGARAELVNSRLVGGHDALVRTCHAPATLVRRAGSWVTVKGTPLAVQSAATNHGKRDCVDNHQPSRGCTAPVLQAVMQAVMLGDGVPGE